MSVVQADTVRDMLTAATGALFKVAEPGPSRMLIRKEGTWFVTIADLSYVELTGHLSAAWEDRRGGVWLETSEIADMIALVERAYGEKGAATMPDAKLGVAPADEMPEEVMDYPKVVGLLRAYEHVVAEASREYGVELKLLYDGGVGVTTVRIGAKIGSPSSDDETFWKQIVKTATVLKAIYARVLEVKPPRA